jgi:hypothetical protein
LKTEKTEKTEKTTMAERKYDLEERLLDFAADVVKLTEAMPNTRAANHVGG